MTEASIVIPLLSQRNEWLEQCIRSAVQQTVSCEVIVVTSPKTSLSNLNILKELQGLGNDLIVLTQPLHTGYAHAFNIGIEHARSGRVGFLLSDDWLCESALHTCLRYSTDIVSTGLVVYDAAGAKPVTSRRRSMMEFIRLPTLEEKASYLKHFLLFKKDKLLEVGGVDEEIGCTGPDDYDLVWTLLERGATTSVVGNPLYNYRDHSGSLRLTLRNREDQVRDLEKILDKHDVQEAEREIIIAQHSQWYGRTIQEAMKKGAKEKIMSG